MTGIYYQILYYLSTFDAVKTELRIGELDSFLAGDVIDIDLESAHPCDTLLEHLMNVLSLVRRVFLDQKVGNLMFLCNVLYDPRAAKYDDASEIGGVLLRYDLVSFNDSEANLLVLLVP